MRRMKDQALQVSGVRVTQEEGPALLLEGVQCVKGSPEASVVEAESEGRGVKRSPAGPRGRVH